MTWVKTLLYKLLANTPDKLLEMIATLIGVTGMCPFAVYVGKYSFASIIKKL